MGKNESSRSWLRSESGKLEYASGITQEERIVSDEINTGKPPPISLIRRLVGYPVMGIGFFIMASPFFGEWPPYDAITFVGGCIVLYAGSICAFGHEVLNKHSPDW